MMLQELISNIIKPEEKGADTEIKSDDISKYHKWICNKGELNLESKEYEAIWEEYHHAIARFLGAAI